MIIILAIVAIGLTSGTVIATQLIEEDLRITAGNGQPGNLIIQDGRLGIHATPGTNQIIVAKGLPGVPASFRVDGQASAAVFSIVADGGTPVLQFVDEDTRPQNKYQIRMGQPDKKTLEIVDATTIPAEIRIKIESNGDICIGAC